MSKETKNVDSKEESLIESSEALAEKVMDAEAYVEKYQKQILIALVAIVVAVGGFYAFQYYTDGQNDIAQNNMFRAQEYFKSDSLNLALNGRDGGEYGFLEIIEKYSGTESANLSHYYAGVIYLKQGEFDKSLEHLKSFSSSDINVQARAYALIGDVYMEKDQATEAAAQYLSAAEYEENEFTSPLYYKKAMLAFEIAGDKQKAGEICKSVLNKYPKSSEANDFKKKLTALTGETLF